MNRRVITASLFAAISLGACSKGPEPTPPTFKSASALGSGGAGGGVACGLCGAAINGFSPPCPGTSETLFDAFAARVCGPFAACASACATSWCAGADASAACKACMVTAEPDGAYTAFYACVGDHLPIVPPDCATDYPELPACTGSEIPVGCNGDDLCPDSAPTCVSCCAAGAAYPLDSCAP